MIGAVGELYPYMLWFCLNMRFKGRVLMVYKSEWFTCRPFGKRFFDFLGGKDSIPRVMLITPEPGIKLSKYKIKKGGHFILRQSL